MMEVKQNKMKEDNSYMFKRFASHNPQAHNGAPNPKAFKNWI